MEVPLSVNETVEGAISLQGIRDSLAKSSTDQKTNTFYVELRMDVTLPTNDLSAIPESKLNDGAPINYTKLTYASQLSTVSQSLTYSSNRASISGGGHTSYYREASVMADLTYQADNINQLGINLLDLQDDSYIATSATYTLSSMKNLADTLKDSKGIKFSLQLMPKKTGEEQGNSTWREEYGAAITEADKYLEVTVGTETVSCDNGTWTWTVPKDRYYDTEKKEIRSNYISESNKFKLTEPIVLKVNVTNVEEQGQFYSNYQVVVTAEVLDSTGNAVTGTHDNDNIIYTLAKIDPTKFILPSGSN